MNFSPLTPADYPHLKPFFKHQPHDLCSYTLLSIIVWQNKDYRPLKMISEDTLLVSTDDNRNEGINYLILPVSPKKEFNPEALNHFAQASGYNRYWFVPESYIDRHGKKAIETYFKIKPQPEYDDYIYLREDLVDLRGNRYSKKRNLIRQFERQFVNSGRVQVEKATTKDAEECAAFIEIWCKERGCDADDQSEMAHERQAALNTIEHLDILEVNGLLLRIDGKICAFGVGAHLTDDMGVLHFEKAFTNIKGLYQYFDNQCARRLFTSERFINKESDMGEANLAKAKKSYHPIRMIRSYQLILQNSSAP